MPFPRRSSPIDSVSKDDSSSSKSRRSGWLRRSLIKSGKSKSFKSSCSSSGCTSTDTTAFPSDHPQLVSVPSTEAVPEANDTAYEMIVDLYKRQCYSEVIERFQEEGGASKLSGKHQPQQHHAPVSWWLANAYLHVSQEKEAQQLLPKLKHSDASKLQDDDLSLAHSSMLNLLVIEGHGDPELLTYALRLAQVSGKTNVAHSLQYDLGMVLLATKPRDAVPHLEACLEFSSSNSSDFLVKVLGSLASAHLAIGDLDRARTYSLERVSRVMDSPHDMALACHEAARIYIMRREPNEATVMLQRGIEAMDERNDLHMKLWNALAQVQCQEGKYAACLETQRDILQHAKEEYGEYNSHVGKTLYAMGRLCVKMKDYPQAIDYFEQQLHVTKTAFGENHMEVSRVLHELAKLYDEELGDFSKALTLYQKALKVEKRVMEKLTSNKKCKHCTSTNRCESHLKQYRECTAQIRDTKGNVGRLLYMAGDFGSAVRTSFPDMPIPPKH